MERKEKFAIDEYYHVYNRGVDGRNIADDCNDYSRLMKSLYLHNDSKMVDMSNVCSGVSYNQTFSLAKDEPLVAVGFYCLMPNHFHLVLKEIRDGGISEFLLKFSTGHSMFYNKKHKRSGALLQGPFKAKRIDSEEYLRYLFAYVHLNPVKLFQKDWKEAGIKDLKKAKEYLQQYSYSSFLEYSGDDSRAEQSIIDKKSFPEYFQNSKEFSEYIDDWLTYKQEFSEGFPF